MILIPFNLYLRSRPSGASDRRLRAAAAPPSADSLSHPTTRRRSEAQVSAVRSLVGKEVHVITLAAPVGPDRLDGHIEPSYDQPLHPAGRQLRPGSIVPPPVVVRIPAHQEHPAVPAESGLVRLQEEIEDQQDRIIALDAYVVAAASDGVFTAEEFAEYRARRNGVLVKQQEVCRDVGFMADALGLVKTLLHIGAITPWAARQARERSEDRLRLLETPPNIIPFPVSDRTA